MARNAPWTAEELILALDLYFRVPPTRAAQNDPRIVELSRILNKLAGRAAAKDPSRYRTPASVYMKMRNFLRFDPSYTSAGLTRGARLEWAIWKGFSDDRYLLRRTAKGIIDRVKGKQATQQESFKL